MKPKFQKTYLRLGSTNQFVPVDFFHLQQTSHPLWKFGCSCLWPNRIRKSWVKTESTELWPKNHYAKKGLVQFHFELFFGCPWISNNKNPPWWWGRDDLPARFWDFPKQFNQYQLVFWNLPRVKYLLEPSNTYPQIPVYFRKSFHLYIVPGVCSRGRSFLRKHPREV